jgi:tRNA dimethylallyltransferase
MKDIPLVIICGPTGIGKTSLGIEIARNINGEIISADSRQIYKDFDIGTAKPTKEERNLIKHYLIDFVEPTYNFTVSEYLNLAKETIIHIVNKNKIPIIVGGTGLYIKAVTEDFDIPKVKPDYEIRNKLKEISKTEEGKSYLYKKAVEIDPKAMEKIHKNDLIRIIRLIEVFETTGNKISEMRKKNVNNSYKLAYLSLDIERNELYKRICIRVNKMIEEGLIDEVKFIINKYGKDLPLLKTINYKEIREYLLGNINLENTIELMKKNTRNFAKRQLTWFRNTPNINIFSLKENSLNDIINFIRKKVNI